MERWYSMIQGITNLNSYLNTMKMQTIWDIAKQNPEKAKIEKQQKQKLYDLEQNQLVEQSKEAEKELKEFQKIIEQAEQYKNTINEKLSVYQNNSTAGEKEF